MKKVFVFIIIVACFMMPVRTLADTNYEKQQAISHYTQLICNITH
jgi:hypothetical protein